MKLTIESTDKFALVDGGRVRIWEGRTESVIECLVFVALVGVEEGKDAQFERELDPQLVVEAEVARA